MIDLLVIGEINPDLILRGEDVTPAFGQAEKLVEDALLTIGSSSVITACGAARLGLEVAFIGLVGEDEFGRFMLDAMQKHGIDTSGCIADPDAATGMSVILSQPHDRAILTFPGTMPLLRLEQIDETLLRRARHLHVGSYFLLDNLRPDLPELFDRAHTIGLTTSLDTNWDPGESWDVARVLPYLDVFFPNETEALRITGTEDPKVALDVLARRVPTLAVKLGPQGGLVRQGNVVFTAPPLPVDVVDTTGAGDSFNAGFLFGFINHWPPAEALRLAVTCGSLSTRASGGTAAQPTLIEAQQAGLQPRGET